MEDLDAATVTDIREFAKPNCAKGASSMMRRGVLVRLLVNRGLVGDEISRLEKMIEMGFREDLLLDLKEKQNEKE